MYFAFFHDGENHRRLALISCFNYCEFRMTPMIKLQTRGFAQGSKPGVHIPGFIRRASQLQRELLSPSSQTSETSYLCLFF